jgi:hypothetical protein
MPASYNLLKGNGSNLPQRYCYQKIFSLDINGDLLKIGKWQQVFRNFF